MHIKKGILATIVVAGTAGILGTTAAFASTSSGSNTTASTSTTQSQEQHTGKHGHWNGAKDGAGQERFGDPFHGVATALKIDQKTLMTDLKAGQSLAQIAQSKGMSEDTLISTLEANFKQQLDKAVSNGKLTAAQETTMVTKFNNNAKNLVERKGLPMNHFDHKRGGGPLELQALIQKLGLDPATVKQSLASGQSLAEIAAAHGISDQTLTSDVQARVQQQIQQEVKDGHLTQAQAQQELTKMNSRLSEMLHAKRTADTDGK